MRHNKEKIDICAVNNCNEPAVKSLPKKKVEEALSESIAASSGRRVHLCKKHYKAYKKATKRERELERLGWQ